MASNSPDAFGNTHTFDAGVNNSDNTGSNLETNWLGGDALGNEDDLFGQFLTSTEKIGEAGPFSGLNNPSFEVPADAAIDPSLRGSATDSPRPSDHASAAGSSWNVPPLGHSFWETFPFQDYMSAAGIRNGTQANPIHFDDQPLHNDEGFSFPAFDQGFPQNQPSQYPEPDYNTAVPGYGAAAETSAQRFGNPMEDFGSTSFHPINGPNSFGGAPDIDTFVSSANPFSDSYNLSGLGLSLPDYNKFNPSVVRDETRGPTAGPSKWHAQNSDSENSPNLPKWKSQKPKADKKSSRGQASEQAKLKAEAAYQLRPRQGPLVIRNPDTNKLYTFEYNRFGELSSFYSKRALRAYIMQKFQGSHQNRGSAAMLIQCVPADSGNRYPTKDLSDKCRLDGCAAKNNTIAQGTFRVAFDEAIDPSKYDPFHTAGFVHLYCLERFFNLKEIAQKCCILPDTRRLKYTVEGSDIYGRLHINRTSSKNERTVKDFLDELQFGDKKASGYDGQPYDYDNTLSWKLTRNATADAKALRLENSKARGGVNMFVHFNDEERRIYLTEKRAKMAPAKFQQWMEELFSKTVEDIKGSEEMSTWRKKTARSSKKRKHSVIQSETTDDSSVRRSPRLRQPSFHAPPAPMQTQESRKRTLQQSDADAQGNSDDESTRSVRPAKRSKRNGPPTPLLPVSQSKANSRPAPLVPYGSSPLSSPLSPAPPSAQPKSAHAVWFQNLENGL